MRAMNRVDAVRRFNRFYTQHVGALHTGFAGSAFPLPEARLVYEIGRRGETSASELGRDLDLDLGYLSRLLQSLRRRGIVQGKPAPNDARTSLLSLTDKGRKSFAMLDQRSREQVTGMLARLPSGRRTQLVGAMQTIETLLNGGKPAAEITLRPHRAGDRGWVVQAHGRLYAEERGWGAGFEALVAQIAGDFLKNFDPQRECCWIAEMDGEPVGSVFVVQQSTAIAKLRLLLVEPRARGHGLGRRQVDECIAFARAKGYQKLVLWTQSNLVPARRIYKAAGFQLVKKQRHQDFGVKLNGEYWELAL
jgi:DNA-binding MarR family transcriptional regulator/predicted GNAT family acetyltransferase